MKNNVNKLHHDIEEFYDYLMNVWRNVEYWQVRFEGDFETFTRFIMEMYYEHFDMGE